MSETYVKWAKEMIEWYIARKCWSLMMKWLYSFSSDRLNGGDSEKTFLGFWRRCRKLFPRHSNWGSCLRNTKCA